MPKLLSGRTPVAPASTLSTTRYKYLSLAQAQPSLGTPTADGQVLIGNVNGQTQWISQTSIVSSTVPTDNVIFVAKNGNDGNAGNSIATPKQTIAGAITAATAGTTIVVFSGSYTENNPMTVPENVSIIGQTDGVTVLPRDISSDVFKLSNASSVQNIIVQNHKAPSFAFSIANNITITEMPSIKNCSSISGPFLNDGTLFIPNVTVQQGSPSPIPKLDADVPTVGKRIDVNGAGGGIYINGDNINTASSYKAVVVENFTAINQGGIGILAENIVTVHVSASTTEFSSYSYKALHGAVLNLNSCTTEYGSTGLNSDNFYTAAYNETIGLSGNSQFSYITSITLSNAGGTGYTTEPTIVIGKEWVASANIALHEQIFYGNRLYFATVAGQLHATVPPTHTTGTVVNGTATLLYTGTKAIATSVISGGKVTNILISSAGTGYTEIPTITFVDVSVPPATAAATADAALSGITEVAVTNLVKTPMNSSLLAVTGMSGKYLITDATVVSGGVSYIKVNPALKYVLDQAEVNFYYDSIIVANGHTFKYAGSGVTFNALPSNGGEPLPNLETVEANYGQIFYSSLNERGVYKLGDVFSVDMVTNTYTVSANTFNITNLGAIGPLIRDGIASGVQMKEISNNVDLKASTGFVDEFTVPTQHAVSQYLIDNYLPLVGGGTVTGNVSFNDLLLSGNTISSLQTDQNIILSPNGTGMIDVANSKIINLLTPINAYDAATKKYVDDLLAGQQTFSSTYIGDMFLTGNTISNNFLNGNLQLTTTGTGQVIVTSTLDSTSTSTGALIVYGGVGIAKTVYVGTAVHSPSFVGNLTGDADNAHVVLDGAQPNITSLGALTSLQVDHVNINGDTIKNTAVDTNLYLGTSGTGGVLPETTLTNFGSSTHVWGSSYFTDIYGTVRTPSQPYINELAPIVSMLDTTHAVNPSLILGYGAGNELSITTTHQGTDLSQATFVTSSSNVANGSMSFSPYGNLALTVANGLVTVEQHLHVNGALTVADSIIRLGPVDKNTIINHDTGVNYVSNNDLTSHLTSIIINSDGTTNTTVVTLNVLIDTVSINANDYLYLKNPSLYSLQNSWKVSAVNLGTNTFNLDIGLTLGAGVYTITVDQLILSKQGFFGYDQTQDAFTVLTNIDINNSVVTGDIGTVYAKVSSPYVNITGGTIANAAIDNTTIGLTDPAAAAFDIVTSNKYHTANHVTVLNGEVTSVDSFHTTFADIAKFIIKIKTLDGSGNILAISGQDLLIVQNGVDIYITEYGIEYTNGPLGTFNASIDGSGYVNLLFTPASTDIAEVTLFRFYA